MNDSSSVPPGPARSGVGPLTPPPVLPVSLLVSSARLLLERHLGLAWVAGEISGFTRAASGHVYFTLKDAAAQVRCVMFRLRAQSLAFPLKDGMAVEVRAVPTIYEPKGELQLTVDAVRLAGMGALYERFVRLKDKLQAAGWFAEGRKRPVPTHANVIGIVTSTRAAALRDVLTTLCRRWPAARIIIYPASVQGAGAAREIAAAIAIANAHAHADVLIVCRGGGSLEDLWAFNEELVARAVFESALPVVSGVGHETDFTICDFVADVRAATPTAAASLVVADRAAMSPRLAQLGRRLGRTADHALATRVQRVDHASRRLIHPAARIAAQRDLATALALRLARAWRRMLDRERQGVSTLANRLARELRAPLPQAASVAGALESWRRRGMESVGRRALRLEALAQNLAHLDPRAVLTRGYAIVARADGTIVRDSAEVEPEDVIQLTFARGTADAAITRRD